LNAPEFHELLSAYLDDAVSADERASVEAHLADSAESRRLLEELRAVRGALQGLPRQHLEADFADRVLRRAEREMLVGRAEPVGEDSSDVVRRLGFRMILWPLIAVAAALLMALVGPELFGPDQALHEPVARHPAEPAPDAQAGNGQRPEENEAERDRIAVDKAFANEHQMGVASVEQAPSDDATAAAQGEESIALEAFRESLGRASALDRSNLQAAERALQQVHAQTANEARKRWGMKTAPAGNSDGQVVYVMVSLKAGANPRQAIQQFVGTVEAADLGDVRKKTTLALDLDANGNQDAEAMLSELRERDVAAAGAVEAAAENQAQPAPPLVLSVHEASLDEVELRQAVQRLEAEPNYFHNVRQMASNNRGDNYAYFGDGLYWQDAQGLGGGGGAFEGLAQRGAGTSAPTTRNFAAPQQSTSGDEQAGGNQSRPKDIEPGDRPRPKPDAADGATAKNPPADAVPAEDAPPATRSRLSQPDRPAVSPTQPEAPPGDLPKAEPSAGGTKSPVVPKPVAGKSDTPDAFGATNKARPPAVPPSPNPGALFRDPRGAKRGGAIVEDESALASQSAGRRLGIGPARRRVVFLLQASPPIAAEAAPAETRAAEKAPAEKAPAKKAAD